MLSLATALFYFLEHVPLYVTLFMAFNMRAIIVLLRMALMVIITYIVVKTIETFWSPIKRTAWKVVRPWTWSWPLKLSLPSR